MKPRTKFDTSPRFYFVGLTRARSVVLYSFKGITSVPNGTQLVDIIL